MVLEADAMHSTHGSEPNQRMSARASKRDGVQCTFCSYVRLNVISRY